MAPKKARTASNSPDITTANRGKAVATSRTKAAAKAKETAPKANGGRSEEAADAKRARDRAWHAQQRRLRKDALIKQQELTDDEFGAPSADSVPNNGRHKGRKLIRWSPFHDQALLLCIQYECYEAKIEIPWAKIAKRIAGERNSTEMSIIQHLNKLRGAMLDQGRFVTPLMGRREQAGRENVRGVIKVGVDIQGRSVYREVGWNEDLTYLFNPKDIQEPVPRGQHILSAPATLKRSQTVANDLDRAAGVLPKVEVGGAAKRRAKKQASKSKEIDPADLGPEDDYEPGRYHRVSRAANRVAAVSPESEQTEDSDDEQYQEYDSDSGDDSDFDLSNTMYASVGSSRDSDANSSMANEQMQHDDICNIAEPDSQNIVPFSNEQKQGTKSRIVVLKTGGHVLNNGDGGNCAKNAEDVGNTFHSVGHACPKVEPSQIQQEEHFVSKFADTGVSDIKHAGTSNPGAGLNIQMHNVSSFNVPTSDRCISTRIDNGKGSGKNAGPLDLNGMTGMKGAIESVSSSSLEPAKQMDQAQDFWGNSKPFQNGAAGGISPLNFKTDILNNQSLDDGLQEFGSLSSGTIGNLGYGFGAQFPNLHGSAFEAVPTYYNPMPSAGNSFSMAATSMNGFGGSFSSVSDGSTGVGFNQSFDSFTTTLTGNTHGIPAFTPIKSDAIDMDPFNDYGVDYDIPGHGSSFPDMSEYEGNDQAHFAGSQSSTGSFFNGVISPHKY